MLKVAIVGCGKIADSHASQIGRIPGCEIVAACDRELLMARQLCERYPIRRHYSDVSELLSDARPDVVHITTPPRSHFHLAKLCLEAGCHVFVEKPFTVYADETRKLLDMAIERGLKMTVGHDGQFSHVARRMRSLVQGGFLGGRPVHMESYYCYPLGKGDYAGAVLGDKQHWVRQLPGKLIQNVISHGLARVAEHLTTESPQVIVHGFISPCLRSMGETEIVDELRMIINEEDRLTAYFTFSSQMRPAVSEFRIYGETNGLYYDYDRDILLKLYGKRHPSFADKFIPPMTLAKQHVGNVFTNLRTFLRRDFHFKSGLKYLLEAFYSSITDGTPLPIPYAEILRNARLMDSISVQLGQRDQARLAMPV